MNTTPASPLREHLRRTAACINACEGMSTEHIEELVSLGGAIALIVKANDYRAQRDELLEVLKEVMGFADRLPIGCSSRVRALIAKAKATP